MQNIGIIGIGWLGIRVAEHLAPRYNIYGTVTDKDKAIRLRNLGYEVEVQDFDDNEINVTNVWNNVLKMDSIIITVPFSRRANLNNLKNRYKNLQRFIEGFEGQIFLMSSTGIYPQVLKQIDETTYRDEDLHLNLVTIERQMKDKFPQLNILRLGGLMGADRQLKNYNIQDTSGVVNYVHYKDICLVIEHMIKSEIRSKTYNVVAPMHPTKHAVINKDKSIIPNKNQDRIILSNKLQIELNYTFRYPNPVKFA